MGLTVRELELRNFRSYQYVKLSNLGPMTIFVGPNAIGKTNLIEAIQLCTACSSFRNPRPNHLLKFGETQASSHVCLSDDVRVLDIDLKISDANKTYFLNGKKKTGASLKGLLPAILFCPDDLNLVKGSSSVRRNQLDSLGTQVSSSYNAVLRDYMKIITQKNRYLKDDASHEYLMAINDVLARVGAQLFTLRARLVEELLPYVNEYYGEISSSRDTVELLYIPSWQNTEEQCLDFSKFSREYVEDCLHAVLENRYEEEHRRHRSLFGPHADKVSFLINGQDASLFASQGQQRSIVLALKVAEVLLVRDRLNQNPVLLLDDVMSELDENRRFAFMDSIPEEVQTFITATTKNYFSSKSLLNAQLIDLGAILKNELDNKEQENNASSLDLQAKNLRSTTLEWFTVDMRG